MATAAAARVVYQPPFGQPALQPVEQPQQQSAGQPQRQSAGRPQHQPAEDAQQDAAAAHRPPIWLPRSSPPHPPVPPLNHHTPCEIEPLTERLIRSSG